MDPELGDPIWSGGEGLTSFSQAGMHPLARIAHWYGPPDRQPATDKYGLPVYRPRLLPRACACGCGVFQPTRASQRYRTKACHMRVYRRRPDCAERARQTLRRWRAKQRAA